MASEQWLLNDTSVANNAYFTAVGSSYKLRNVSGGTYNRRTTSPTPYEGSGYYASGLSNQPTGRFYTSSSTQLTGGTYYHDAYFYLVSAPPSDVLAFTVTGDDTNVLYTWIQIGTDRRLSIFSYDNVNGQQEWTNTATNMVPTGAWFRLAYKTNASGVNEVKLFKGTNINGTTADATLTKDFSAQSPFSSFGAWEFEAFCADNTTNTTAALYVDDIKFDTAAYPTRGTAYTADASSTGTATGTASIASTRPASGSGTETATGTATGSLGQSLAGAPSITASATAAMASTQAMSGSASITASGTAAASVTSIITIAGSGTATASGVAGASSIQVVAGSATSTATGSADASIRPIITVDGVGTITASGVGAGSKQQTLVGVASATATATSTMIFITQITGSGTATATATATALPITPGTLYGNAEKVAGLYGSSTKPTLTTRS